ncbi:hypothetical protein [Streptomyces uncialis]|uniref:hypothetical protein n=1 Tax=Streptomyces uncialis TaxID=1048205 RepID=UPI0033ED73CD
MAEQRDALTELVRLRVGKHTDPSNMSVADFAEKAVDPVTGYRPSTGLIGKIIAGQGFKIGPELISALAEGLELDREVVAAAAHFQVIGYTATELTGGAPATVLHRLDAPPLSTVKSQSVADRWDDEE